MRARKLAETFVLKSRRTLRAMVGFRPRRRVIRLLRKGSAISNFDADASALDLPLIERTPVTLSGLDVGHVARPPSVYREFAWMRPRASQNCS